jgi:cytochrome c peroxidase
MLFYDPILSRDGTVSCSSCHQQHVAFADPLHPLSIGVDERVGTRNALPIQNMAFQQFFFWDGGVNHLDFVPINAITNPVEFDESVSDIVEKLNASLFYKNQFNKTFGQQEVTSQKVLHALSQFMLLMISADSRYDKYVRNEGELLSTQEQKGLLLFKQHCATCHSTDLFTNGDFLNNGLDNDENLDEGRARITEFAGDKGKFKVPSLRNVALTDPYMHDGRFNTLSQVLQHYANGIKISATVDNRLFTNDSPGLLLTEEEQEAIIVFLQTLTDDSFIKDKRFAAPIMPKP